MEDGASGRRGRAVVNRSQFRMFGLVQRNHCRTDEAKKHLPEPGKKHARNDAEDGRHRMGIGRDQVIAAQIVIRLRGALDREQIIAYGDDGKENGNEYDDGDEL